MKVASESLCRLSVRRRFNYSRLSDMAEPACTVGPMLFQNVAAPPPVGGLGGGRKKLPGATQGPRNWVGKDGKGIIFFQKSFYKKLRLNPYLALFFHWLREEPYTG